MKPAADGSRAIGYGPANMGIGNGPLTTPAPTNVAVGRHAGWRLQSGEHCVFIGEDAGADIEVATGLTIIGDGLRTFDRERYPDTLTIGSVMIGTTLFGRPLNIRDIIAGRRPTARRALIDLLAAIKGRRW